MNFKEIQELIRLVSKSDLAEFKVKDGEFELSIKTQKALKMPEMQAISYQPSYTMQPTQHQAAPAPKALEAAAAPAGAPESGKKQIEIKSPMVGTFYRSGGPDKPPFVKVGDKIDSGKTVCIIEAMKLFNEIESEVKGTIVKVCVEDASPVEYDQVLFILEP
ncbi:MAG: acetyl-CoA carboxylase biotin carboxyl carrier protein [Saprospiraceae bacterium]|nr:acetyl-CoA carboxylase biotin carboxyl carrier protein [Candidatus Vicinibacter affinis]MBK7799259.1 acetyl-CoA carboxylase biotin carboxyl carrier protein [Candidatus Vicinibacter affinis]MBK8642759.1 acetyl-CoA carboxylase biotin carboxyl carrier protein [Candidatus Vicinibacter affinis]MBK9642913.1 acetyl-CoA carboxylase biotin carboxyl carrier protein [Candidatus Vicinibacter affinis]MBP6398091.1 acetyl-CoA carboxylase biotin carboxyl carrier protein [Saprospiraceae bacterium]